MSAHRARLVSVKVDDAYGEIFTAAHRAIFPCPRSHHGPTLPPGGATPYTFGVQHQRGCQAVPTYRARLAQTQRRCTDGHRSVCWEKFVLFPIGDITTFRFITPVRVYSVFLGRHVGAYLSLSVPSHDSRNPRHVTTSGALRYAGLHTRLRGGPVLTAWSEERSRVRDAYTSRSTAD